jgi:hypothetical protein
MATVLLEDQHEVINEDESVSLVFGTADTGYLTTTYPVINGGDDRSGDVGRVREDGLSLGEDYKGGKTVSFEVSVLTDGEADPTLAGSDALATFEAVWRNQKFRNSSTAYAVLRSVVGGRTRRAYGRPRRYDEVVGNLTKKGVTPVVCDFLVPDGTWYDDLEDSQAFSITPPSTSGLVAPLVTPLTTTTISVNAVGMTVGGKLPTWPVITIHGPVINPMLRFNDDLTVGMNVTLAAGESITVDPRPWRRVVLRNDGANLAGSLTWETPPMRRMKLDPGVYDVSMSGVDATGTSWCSVTWRSAYPRW